MITVVLTYRNREFNIVKNCLDSLNHQTNKNFSVTLVNYGSTENNKKSVIKLSKNYSFVSLLSCETEKQLWSKSKAINIALKQCKTPYFFVGDIDMIYRSDFVNTLYSLKKEKQITYFQVGFLSETESKNKRSFSDYRINFKSNKEATGMTLYHTEVLKYINGYDEFYHGWGSEDTDVHIRLLKAGFKVDFYDENVLMLHQWHPKLYRSKESKEPFHSSLEQINHQYIKKVEKKKQYLANTVFEWGIIPRNIDFSSQNSITFTLTNLASEVDAFLYGYLEKYKNENLIIKIVTHNEYKSLKNFIKKILGKKYLIFYNYQTINNLLLANIIALYRDKYYEFEWNKTSSTIILKIVL